MFPGPLVVSGSRAPGRQGRADLLPVRRATAPHPEPIGPYQSEMDRVPAPFGEEAGMVPSRYFQATAAAAGPRSGIFSVERNPAARHHVSNWAKV